MSDVVKGVSNKKEPIDAQKIPNKKTLKALKDIEEGKGLVRAKDADDLFKKLGI